MIESQNQPSFHDPSSIPATVPNTISQPSPAYIPWIDEPESWSREAIRSRSRSLRSRRDDDRHAVEQDEHDPPATWRNFHQFESIVIASIRPGATVPSRAVAGRRPRGSFAATPRSSTSIRSNACLKMRIATTGSTPRRPRCAARHRGAGSRRRTPPGRADRPVATPHLRLALHDDVEGASGLTLADDGLPVAERRDVGVIGQPAEMPARQPGEERDVGQHLEVVARERTVGPAAPRGRTAPHAALRDRSGRPGSAHRTRHQPRNLPHDRPKPTGR